MFEIAADGGDWNIGLMWPARLYMKIAKVSMEQNRIDEALSAVEEAVECACRADSLKEGGNRRSLMLNATEVIANTSGTRPERVGCRYCRQQLENSKEFDPIRNTPEYAVILEKLGGEA